ncbi:Nif3-like dinuclear metal center hexameric protein [Phosphitispora fastidiosa]|uniref:Nif3-like dinuclear metal center hexameric protein n=1 Tax=Phosphitispora fastidiosa TaxID=2837202 RepID=UPI001E3616AE|nr:Nif3-like dinuclear metal center hexameric protein [Phosphitispora fastidiosa]MBU7005818.1 dinuclear metal center YbgI/SA1388 family protein [Phosphitispora fastidiosa]
MPALKCQTVINLMENYFPKSLAEEWDSIGLQVGDPGSVVTGVMVTLDINVQTAAEAVTKGANMIVSHHPLIFKPLKHIRRDLAHGSLLAELIKNDISVYCAHTNMDSAREGVNQELAELLELQDLEVLNPDKTERLFKIVVYIPRGYEDVVREAMARAGAGWIGNYSDCTFSVQGTGTFKAAEGCDPFIGQVGVLEKTDEFRMETVIREEHVHRVVKAMIKAHPYEEVAYDIFRLENTGQRMGLGRVGTLPQAVRLEDLLKSIKRNLNISNLRYGGSPDMTVRKIAVCGGSGASLMHKAAFAGADVFLTGDLKYHEAQDILALKMAFVDAGHFATEFPVVDRVAGLLRNGFDKAGYSVPVHVSENNNDPFGYF